jgi:hypothetical protein
MNRIACAAGGFAIVLALTGAGWAGVPRSGSPSVGSDSSEPWTVESSDTAQHDIPASPSCGAANPQGGIPSAVTWGDCP